MVQSSIPRSGPFIGSMVGRPDKAPDQLRFFDMHIDTTGRGLGFRIELAGTSADLEGGSNADIWASAEKLVADAMASGKFPNQCPSFFNPQSVTGPRPRSYISLDNPLPVKVDGKSFPESQRCLFVFRLAKGKGSAKANWRFGSHYAPFSIGEESASAGKNTIDPADVFSHAMHCANGAFVIPGPDVRPWDKPYDVSDWACFLYDYETAFKQAGTRTFFLKYNMHVEIEDVKTKGLYIPLMIDPDVGHPGPHGSGPPGP